MRMLLANIGKGLVAGAIGTAVMTLSSTLEMKLRGRPGSTVPADAAAKVLDLELADDYSVERFSNLVHWGYGTAWGAIRGILASLGVKGPGGTAAHFALIWGTALVMLPSLKVAPPPTEWGGEEVAIDAMHHLVYAIAAGAAFDVIDAAEE